MCLQINNEIFNNVKIVRIYLSDVILVVVKTLLNVFFFFYYSQVCRNRLEKLE